MLLPTAAAYLDMKPSEFLDEVGRGSLPPGHMHGRKERWDRVAIDAVLDDNDVGQAEDWRALQPGLANPAVDTPLKLNPDVFNVGRLAEYWSCSDSTIYKLIKDGSLRSFRFGNLIRITREAIEEYEERALQVEADRHSRALK